MIATEEESSFRFCSARSARHLSVSIGQNRRSFRARPSLPCKKPHCAMTQALWQIFGYLRPKYLAAINANFALVPYLLNMRKVNLENTVLSHLHLREFQCMREWPDRSSHDNAAAIERLGDLLIGVRHLALHKDWLKWLPTKCSLPKVLSLEFEPFGIHQISQEEVEEMFHAFKALFLACGRQLRRP